MLSPVAEPSIDIVYLWVDGNDPVWRAKRHRAALGMDAAQTEALAPFGNVEGRFRDNDELRYSLRALERFFPDHGHVYLVTDEQTPIACPPSIPATSSPTFTAFPVCPSAIFISTTTCFLARRFGWITGSGRVVFMPRGLTTRTCGKAPCARMTIRWKTPAACRTSG